MMRCGAGAEAAGGDGQANGVHHYFLCWLCNGGFNLLIALVCPLLGVDIELNVVV